MLFLFTIAFVITFLILKLDKNKKRIEFLENESQIWENRAKMWKKRMLKLADNISENKKQQREYKQYISHLQEHVDALTNENKQLLDKINTEKTNIVDEFVLLIQYMYSKKNRMEKCLKKIIDIGNILNIDITIKHNNHERNSKTIAKNKIANFYSR
jgi:chromosome segregation ATPase